MQTIQSFTVNHDKLKPGMYLSRIDGDCVTYDIRMVTPNAGIYLENDGLHTFEHLFATYVRNTPLLRPDHLRRADGLPDGVLLHYPGLGLQRGRHPAGAGNLPFHPLL